MILTSDYKSLNHQTRDSFFELLSDVQSKYNHYYNSLQLEQNIMKNLKQKHRQLIIKIDFLAQNLEESTSYLDQKKAKLLEIDIKHYENIAEYFNSKLFSFLSFSSKSNSLSNFKKILENFNFLQIPDWMVETKEETIWKDCIEFEDFISLSVDCKMKHDLLNNYNIKKLDTEREMYIQRIRIESLQNRIKHIMKSLDLYEEYSETDTEEQEFVLDSDELYGKDKNICDTSTMIFDESPLCSGCCIVS